MKLGRNDPCPCGSGKKYKNCCLTSSALDEDRSADEVWRKVRSLLEGHPYLMLSFIEQHFGKVALGEAWDEFVLDRDIEFDSQSPLLTVFLPNFFHFWSPDVDTTVANPLLRDVRPTEAYLAKRRRSLDPLLVAYLESCLRSPFSFFDVVAVRPDRVVLQDIFTRVEHEVVEHSASSVLHPGDVVFAQLASVRGIEMIEAYGGFQIAPQEKAAIIGLRANIAKADGVITDEGLRDYDIEMLQLLLDIHERAFNPRLPELQNTDGEPLSLRNLVYDLVVTPQAAFDALKHLSLDEPEETMLHDAERDAEGVLRRATIVWRRQGNALHTDWERTNLGLITIEGARLTVEVNSKERGDVIAEIIESALGEGADFRFTRVTSAEELAQKARERAESGVSELDPETEALNDLPEEKARIAEMTAAHFERWVDTALPILDGQTPREAVTDAAGREIVEALVLQFERDSVRMRQPADPAMFERLRETLGISSGIG